MSCSSLDVFTNSQTSQRICGPLLAQNDNVLIAQSRNVLLTRSGWGGGIRNTSHDPAGPRSVDRSEKGQEGANHTASGRRRDRPNRTAYPAAAGKAEKRGRPGGGPLAPGTSVQLQTGREEPGEGGCDLDRPNRTAYPASAGKAETRGRPGGGPRAPGTSVQPQTGREEPGEGGSDPRAREVSRVRPHAGQRIPWQASPDHSQPRNGEGLDDRSAAMAVPETKSGESPRVAPAAATVRRTGAVGHQRAPMARRARAEALPDQHDRRCHQPAACTFCSPRLDRGKHAFAVELFGAPWTSAELLHRQGEPVSNRAQDPAGFHRTAPRRARTTAAHANWTGASRSGDRLDRSPLATGQGTGGTQFSDGAGPSGERLACGRSHDSGASQCLPGNRVHSLVEPDSGCRAGHGGRCTPSARQGPFAAGFVELCRKLRSRQWVHDPVRQQDLPDRPHGYSCRPARSSGADRSPAGWIHGLSLPRSLPGSERVFGAPQSSGACQETQKTRPHPTSQKSVDEKLLLHQSRQGRSFRDPSKTHSVGRANAARPSSRFLYSKPPLGSFTKVSTPQKAKPSEGTPQGPVDRGLAAVYFGANSVASALNLPQERDLPKNHPHFKPNLSAPPSKQDISTLRGIGHFYFALTWLDGAAQCRYGSGILASNIFRAQCGFSIYTTRANTCGSWRAGCIPMTSRAPSPYPADSPLECSPSSARSAPDHTPRAILLA